MNKSIYLVTPVLIISLALIGCSDNATNGNSASNASANSASGQPAKDEVLNEAPTLKPAFTKYCEAMTKKDEAALRKVYSSDTVADFEKQMKDDNIKTLVEFLADEKITTDLCNIRNEVITGDMAVAEIIVESYPNGLKVVFVKDGGEWKITNRSPAIDAVKNAANSNTTAAPANTK